MANLLKNLLWPRRRTITGVKRCVRRSYAGAIGLVDVQCNTEVEHERVSVE